MAAQSDYCVGRSLLFIVVYSYRPRLAEKFIVTRRARLPSDPAVSWKLMRRTNAHLTIRPPKHFSPPFCHICLAQGQALVIPPPALLNYLSWDLIFLPWRGRRTLEQSRGWCRRVVYIHIQRANTRHILPAPIYKHGGCR